jgi:RNA polymerase sigma factor (sigma-70 family)
VKLLGKGGRFSPAAGTVVWEARQRGEMAEFPSTRASLLVRLRDPRDEEAWGQFVDLYAPVVYGFARKQGLQDADAADLSQEVLRAVHGSVGRLDYDPARGAFRNWLFTVVRRKLSNWRRAEQNRASGEAAAAVERCLTSVDPEAEWEAEWKQGLFIWACEQVRRDVAGRTWQAFWLTAVDGRPGQEVADELGLSLTSVYHARSRIVARLRELVRSAQEP